jgi:hypothetical protein
LLRPTVRVLLERIPRGNHQGQNRPSERLAHRDRPEQGHERHDVDRDTSLTQP